MHTKEAGAPTDTLKEEENHRSGAGPMKLLAMLAPWTVGRQLLENQEAEIIRYWGYETLTQQFPNV